MKYLSSFKNKDLSGKTCLLRVDFNVEDAELRRCQREKSGVPLRISAVLPTIKFLLGKGIRVVILSHRGRPSEVKSLKLKVKKFSLKSFAGMLSKLLNKQVRFIGFETGFKPLEIAKIIDDSKDRIFLLENLRFLSGEEKNDRNFAKKLASLGDFYVNDAFSVSHRANASVEAITKFLPSFGGLALEKELKNLDNAMKNPKKPLVVVLGGAKISDKIGIIDNFMKKADKFLIGGGIANTFLAARNFPVGHSLYEKDMIPLCRRLLKSDKIFLPIDSAFEKGRILDIGAKTAEEFAGIISRAKTVIWNGPMGYIEDEKFRKGSEVVLEAILKSGAFSIIGGGETTSIIKSSELRIQNSNVFVSTGGGAMLDYLAGKKLPGLKALK